jgi:hypothetical protein
MVGHSGVHKALYSSEDGPSVVAAGRQGAKMVMVAGMVFRQSPGATSRANHEVGSPWRRGSRGAA